MAHELRVFEDMSALADAAAVHIADRARAVQARGATFTMALSGGTSPWATFERLARESLYWPAVRLYQVDERVVGAENDLRNLKHIRAAFVATEAPIVPMDVEGADLEVACAQYAAELPERFDLIQLGVGPDGHCASLIPGDPVLEVSDRDVALAGPYQDTLRMTLTYPALARTSEVIWLITGADKRDALARLLENDHSIPAGRVEAAASLIMADRAAAGS